jgi:hypothetical protein
VTSSGSSADSGGIDDTGTTASGGADDAGGDDGCGCTAGPRGASGLLVGLLALLSLRRRRAGGVAVVAILNLTVCGDDVTNTSATTTGVSGSTDETSTGEVAALPPEAWVGFYRWGWGYEGEPISRPTAGAWLELEIRDDGTCIYSTVACTSTEPNWTEVYECLFHDGFVRMRNFDGSAMTHDGRLFIDFHFGTECGILHEYWIYDVDDYPPNPRVSPWYRGRFCVIETCPEDAFDRDPHDSPILDEPWVYDLCPGEPTDCPCVETATACLEVEQSR